MRRAIVAVALLVSVATHAQGADWLPIVKGLEHKVLRVESLVGGALQPSICSAVVINAARGFALTVAHCVVGESSDSVDVTIAGREAAVVRSNRLLDLAVLRMDPRASDVSIPLAEKTPPAGSPLAVVGFAFGSKQLTLQFGYLSLPLATDDDTMRIAVDVIAGDSGGAVIDETGRLIGVTSAVRFFGPMHLGVAVPVETIKEYISQYQP